LTPVASARRRRCSTCRYPIRLTATLKDCVREGDPASAAARAAAAAFAATSDASAAAAEVFALWVFDLALAVRLRWERPCL
jgi:hypothetical protein